MTTADDTELLDLIPPEAEIVRRIVDEVRRYPRIRRPLLRFLAADDFDELMAAVRENSDNIKLILERMGVMDDRMGTMENRMGVMEERLTSVEGAVERIDHNVRSLQGSVGQLRGDSYENKCAEEIEGILDGYLKNAVLADRERIRVAFRNVRDNNLITREEFVDAYRPDIIARAAHDDDETEGLAVVEVSVTFNREDLEAASRRAELIGRVTGVPTAAYLVTHHEWPAEMDAAARDLDVTIVRHAIPEYAI